MLRCVRCGRMTHYVQKISRHWWCSSCASGARAVQAMAPHMFAPITEEPVRYVEPEPKKKMTVPRTSDIEVEEIDDESL